MARPRTKKSPALTEKLRSATWAFVRAWYHVILAVAGIVTIAAFAIENNSFKKPDNPLLAAAQRHQDDRRIAHKPNLPESTSTENREHSPTPTPDQIKKIVVEAPPLMRGEVSKQFVGKHVKWEGIYYRAFSTADSGVLYFRVGETEVIVPFEPSLEYMKAAKLDTKYEIKGTIRELNTEPSPVLENVTLTRLD